MRATLKIPGLSAAASQMIVHVLTVFLAAFLTQLVGGAVHVINESTLLSLLVAASAAGATAVIHYLFGLIPTPLPVALRSRVFGVTLKVTSAFYQVLVSVIVTFVTVFGASLAGGATGVESLSALESLIIAAISAAVAAVVHYVTHLIPAPAASLPGAKSVVTR
jgi:hypothetical protein